MADLKPQIVVDNKFCKIENENDAEFLSKLNKHLSFQYIGAEFTPAFQRYGWDGKEYLLSKKLLFMTGLLDRVINFYKENNKEINIINNNKNIIQNNELDILDNLNKLNIIPRDYQVKAVNQSTEHDRLVLKHCTGAGKSLTAALITAKFNKPTIVYVISKELLYQFHQFFSKIFDEPIGIVGDGICEIGKISIVSIQTAGRALGMKKKEVSIEDVSDEEFDDNNKDKIINLIKNAKINIYDEAHVCSTTTIKKIYKASNPEKIIGMSGTFCRDDGADLLLEGIVGSAFHEVSASELIRRKILSKPFIKFLYVKGYSHFTETYQEVYKNHIVNNDYRNKLIVDEAEKLINKGYQVLVLFKTIKHGKIIKDLFEKRNIDIEFLSGKDNAKKREQVKENLLSKKSMCCVSSTVYDIGVDIYTLGALVLAGSGKSLVRTKQRIGRILRDGENKPFSAVVEFYDDVRYLKKHSLARKSIYETEPEFVIKMPQLYKNDKKK